MLGLHRFTRKSEADIANYVDQKSLIRCEAKFWVFTLEQLLALDDMFSSGVGTPPTTRVSRRAASRATRSSVAPSSQQYSPPPASVTASIRTATTLRAPSRRGVAVSDAGSAMEVEEGEDQQMRDRTTDNKQMDKVLVKDDSYIVTERKGLPVEVQQAISLAGQSQVH